MSSDVPIQCAFFAEGRGANLPLRQASSSILKVTPNARVLFVCYVYVGHLNSKTSARLLCNQT